MRGSSGFVLILRKQRRETEQYGQESGAGPPGILAFENRFIHWTDYRFGAAFSAAASG